MTTLPITHITLYKHGVGFFCRRGPISGESIKLTFGQGEMDDMLKSLTIIDHSSGQVQGVDYDTPQTQRERLAGCAVVLDNKRSSRDLLQALRGRAVKLLIKAGEPLTGVVVGLDEPDNQPTVVTLWQTESQTVTLVDLNELLGIELLDDTITADLQFFLQNALVREKHSITVRLSSGDHDLEVNYIAPAPTWRVSYRVVIDEGQDQALLQGWGIFDNWLEEDLMNISLSFVAGLPFSFQYNLYIPLLPKRAYVTSSDFNALARKVISRGRDDEVVLTRKISTGGMQDSVSSVAVGKEMSELFQYNVNVPVTVGRGQSAMVPIISTLLKFDKKLIFNNKKVKLHPIATIRLANQSELTLEEGPVTIIEAGEYIGEGLLSFTPNGAEAIISHAVELGVVIKEEAETKIRLNSLQLRDVSLWHNFYDIRHTIYSVENRTMQDKKILIEHERSNDYKPFNTVEPKEETVWLYRYEVEAIAGKTTTFIVKERRLRSNEVKIQNLSYKSLRQYLRAKFLDDKTYHELKAVLDGLAKIKQLEEEIVAQEKLQAGIFQMQEQIQKSMVGLAKEGEEGALRNRYVQRITKSEEELNDVRTSIKKMQADIKQEEHQIMQWLALFS